jgi:hypothetical protein
VPLYETLGFTKHPFSKTNADEEPDLANYFVPPPYFDAVIGDSSSPSASVILAPRGAGKSALRRMVESNAFEYKFLAVTYDRFEFGVEEKVSDISLQYHLRNIITRILLSFLSYLSDYTDIAEKLSRDEKKQLSIFVSTYLGDLTGDRLQELMKELKSLPDKFKEFWANNVGFMESVVNFILKSYELEKIDLPDIKHEQKRLSETYKYQLEMLLKLVKKLGFESIYILIDRIDETEQTGNNPEASYRLIQPLIKDLELLGLNGYGFKFFLWDKIEPFYREDARPDRIAQYNLNWTRQTLNNVLSKRLMAFSNGKIQSIQDLTSTQIDIDIDDSICLMAGQSPRNLIRICEQIFATQAEREEHSEKIDIQAIDMGIGNFSEILSREIYGEDLIKNIQKIGRELFTINQVANDVLKISVQAARSKINAWSQTGLVKQVGTITISSSNRPVHFYCVIEPAVVRLIHRTEDFVTFIKNRWLPCDHCETDNLIDIELYPDNNIAACKNCGRDLV